MRENVSDSAMWFTLVWSALNRVSYYYYDVCIRKKNETVYFYSTTLLTKKQIVKLFLIQNSSSMDVVTVIHKKNISVSLCFG